MTSLSTLIVSEPDCTESALLGLLGAADEVRAWIPTLKIIFLLGQKLGCNKEFINYQSNVLVNTEQDMRNGDV